MGNRCAVCALVVSAVVYYMRQSQGRGARKVKTEDSRHGKGMP